MDVPWLVVAGFGSHIKSTRNTLVIQKEGSISEYPLEGVRHLLVVGGHTLHTPVINRLIRQGSRISFFEADGKPVGSIRPPVSPEEQRLSTIQKETSNYEYALAVARASMRSKTLLIGRLGEKSGKDLFYEGEPEILSNAEHELEFLIKISEIRRLHRLTSDMYYEVLSRAIPVDFGYRRRTERPYHDPVNAIIAFGYAMLYGNVLFSITGSNLDPDTGMLFRGNAGLVRDIMEPIKAGMIDYPAVQYSIEDLGEDSYECGSARCILSDPCIRDLIRVFHGSIDQCRIDRQVAAFRESIEQKTPYVIEF